MNAQELIQARIGEVEAEAKAARANARDLMKQAKDQDGIADYAEVQIAELKAALDTLNEPIKVERKKAMKK
jgi:hypothetical protein